MGIQWNDDALRKLQEDANRKVQEVVRGVDAEMSGAPVDEVHRTLVERLKALGVEPDDDGVREYAQAISDGSLRE